MHFLGTVVAVLGVASQVTASPHPQRALRRAAPKYVVNETRANAVKEAFQISWDGYYEYAFPHDSLNPVSNGYSDDR